MHLRSSKVIRYIPQGRNIRKTVYPDDIPILYYVAVMYLSCICIITSITVYILTLIITPSLV